MRLIKLTGVNTWPPQLENQEISAEAVRKWFIEADIHGRYTAPALEVCHLAAYQIYKAVEVSRSLPSKTIVSDETRALAKRFLKSLRKDFEAGRTLGLDSDEFLAGVSDAVLPCTEQRRHEPVKELARRVAQIGSAAWRQAGKAPRGTDPSSALVAFVQAALAACNHDIAHERVSWLLKSGAGS